jgi:predicted nucleic-acid-binding protein
MPAVDTNVLVRLIIRDDTTQMASAERFIEGGVWVSTMTLAETLWVLRSVYGHSASDLAATIQMLINEKHVILEDSDAVEAALDLFRSRPSLKFSDCLILQLARKAGHLPLGTFDRSLGRVAGTHKL